LADQNFRVKRGLEVGVGKTILYADPGGNVGVSTTNPQATLHVVDEFLLSTAGAASTQRISQKAYTTDNGTLSWEGSAGQLFSITNNLTSGSIFSVNDVSGIPSIDVDADGTIQLAPFGSTEFVGVGKTNPTAKLDVNGTLNVTGVSTFQGNVNLGDNDRLRFGDGVDLEIYSDGSTSYIQETGASSALWIKSNSTEIRTGGNNPIAKFIDNAGVELYYAFGDKKFETTGAGVTITGIATATTFVSTQTTGTAPFTVSSTTLVSNLNADLLDGQEGSYYLDYNNFVGIATDADKLDGEQGSYYRNASNINAGTIGDAYLPATISSDITGNAATATTATNVVGTANRILYNNATDTTTTSNNLVFDGNDVGIGTDNPSQKLDVNGSIRIRQRIYDSNNSAGSANYVLTSGGSGGVWSWQAVSAIGSASINISEEGSSVGTFSNINFTSSNLTATGTGSTATITLTDTPTFTDLKVTGISTIPTISGLTTFQDNVEFKGNVDLGDQDRLRLGNSQDLQIYHTSVDSFIQDTGTGNLYIDSSTLIFRNELASENVRITSSGDVGIGTDNPGTRLEISAPTSAGAISNALSLTQAGTGSGTGTRLLIGYDTAIGTYGSIEGFYDGTGTSLTFGTSENAGISAVTERVRIDGSGNVGIGTDKPTQKLDVRGNILVNDTTVVGSETSSLSTLTQTAIHTALPVATYRSVEYTIQATQGTNFHATKILALHNGTTAYHSEYGTIFNNSSVASFDVDISGGNLRLLATGASASQTDYVVNFVATKV